MSKAMIKYLTNVEGAQTHDEHIGIQNKGKGKGKGTSPDIFTVFNPPLLAGIGHTHHLSNLISPGRNTAQASYKKTGSFESTRHNFHQPDTHHCWACKDSMGRELCLILLRMTSIGYRTQKFLILSPTPYPLGHMLPTPSLKLKCQNIMFIAH